ncbi:hypothetical protein HL658_33145 [Azospirillum sp. RWY-5-1]|uniref:Uncharacterized protein n=1 Tax=Azospirillum oleiclasticum TaxID=2735135 RepID=A0ABX2TL96_9PROT|nr:hypothetical protein [Azospirillum oleiclasticum]NYZ17415.1 hypothetical protein [Azospirillum oleiclasticum]NYZ24792.1 hypothetical protein [Azospirillum oleiclasticum]
MEKRQGGPTQGDDDRYRRPPFDPSGAERSFVASWLSRQPIEELDAIARNLLTKG